jgi:hypothetical protein
MLTFRIMNLRKRQLCNPILAIKLLKKGTFLTTLSLFLERDGNYAFHELDFENNRQVGRSRDVTWSSLYLVHLQDFVFLSNAA